MRGEEGVRLDRQLVDGQMRRLEGERRGEVGFAVGKRLPRQRVHQVDVEGLEGALCLGDGRARLRGVVNSAERGQARVVEALHADRKPRHAGGAKGAKAVALEAARVGLERDLAARLERQAGADGGDQPLDLRRLEQARRAAADEDRVDAPAPDEGQRCFEIGDQGVDIALLRQLRRASRARRAN